MPKETPEKRVASLDRASKKKYQPPRLVEYGDLRHIVLVTKRSFLNDGAGKPKTKR